MRCAHCGSEVPPGSRYCAACGVALEAEPDCPETSDVAPAVPREPGDASTGALRQDGDAVAMEWVATLSILRNKVVLSQLGLVYAIPLLVLFVVLAAILRPGSAEGWRLTGSIVLIAGGFYLFLMAVAVLVVYGGRYESVYRLDRQGIGGRPHGRTATKNRIANLLLLLSGNATAAGAGALAEARQVEYVAWRDVDAIASDGRHRTITLLRGRWPRMVVACTADNHAAVEAFARGAIDCSRPRRPRRRAR